MNKTAAADDHPVSQSYLLFASIALLITTVQIAFSYLFNCLDGVGGIVSSSCRARPTSAGRFKLFHHVAGNNVITCHFLLLLSSSSSLFYNYLLLLLLFCCCCCCFPLPFRVYALSSVLFASSVCVCVYHLLVWMLRAGIQ